MSEAEQMTLAETASRAAHDFKNLLAIILGNAELLEESAGDGDAAQMIGLILEAAQRGTELAERLAQAASGRDAGGTGS